MGCLLSPFIPEWTCEECIFINAVTVERQKRVVMPLWRLGTNTEYRIIRHLLGVGLSIACAFGNDICEAIVTMLGHRYIRIPQGNGI